MTVKKTQKSLSATLEKTEQTLGGLENSLGNNEKVNLLATAEDREANDGLPEGWINTNIGDIASVNSGVGFPKKYQGHLEGDYPVYKVGDVSKAFLNAKGKLSIAGNYVSAATALEMKGKIFPVGATAFAKIGEAVRLNRRVLIQRQGLVDNNVMVVKSDQSCMDYYVYQFLRTQSLDDVTQSTTVPSVRKGDIEELKFPLPPLAEQAVIAQTLDTLLAQVDNIKTRLDAIPKILKTFRQSVLAAAVSGKLTEEWRGENECEQINLNAVKSFWVSQYQAQGKKMPKAKYVESHKLGVIPSSWVATKIGEVFDVYVGATPSRANKKYWGGNIPWVSSSEVAFCKIRSVKEFITRDGLDNTSTNLHPIGTVMLAMIGQGKTRGQAAILKLEACHNQNTAAMRVPQGFALSEYLYFFLFKQYEETRRAGGGNNQQALNKSSVQSLPFPLPPLEEQTQIVLRVEELFAFADQIEQQVKNAQGRVNNLTQSILAKAFRGELTAQWRAENPDLITGENSAKALLAKIKEEREKLKPKKVTKKKAVRKSSLK